MVSKAVDMSNRISISTFSLSPSINISEVQFLDCVVLLTGIFASDHYVLCSLLIFLIVLIEMLSWIQDYSFFCIKSQSRF